MTQAPTDRPRRRADAERSVARILDASEPELRARHGPVLASLQPLIERGRREGAFRADVPAGWHLAMILALIHAASAELQAGNGSPDEVESALVATMLGAVR
jgi:hypothetical protein